MEEPLIVYYPLEEFTPNRKAQKKALDVETLLPPLHVCPPSLEGHPPFIYDENFWDVEAEILANLARADCDGDAETNRVPPVAVISCSRGGKIRALCEIAHRMWGCESVALEGQVAAIYVTFNGFSSLSSEENKDPLQALCRRIAFMASPHRRLEFEYFSQFRLRDEFVSPSNIIAWLDDRPAVLLIDELNNLTEITKKNSNVASQFADFIKVNFLSKCGRHFVFSSHVLDTVEFLGEFMDPSKASCRAVVLQELPVVQPMDDVWTKLEEGSMSARHAMYYGLVPGMIYSSSRSYIGDIAGLREAAVQQFVEESKDLRKDFEDLLSSLFTGLLVEVRPPLHILLDTRAEDSANGTRADKRIRWIPYHLQYICEIVGKMRAKLPFPYRDLATSLGKLCAQLHDAKETSGDGFEGLFVLVLLARCMVVEPDDLFVPKRWFEKSPQG